MGLQEQRLIQEFQDNEYKDLVSQINEIVGKEVEFEVNWDSIVEEGYSDPKSNWINLYFKPLLKVLPTIASDDLGKQALQEKLTKITIQNTLETSNKTNAISFTDGNLVIDHLPNANVPDCDAFDGKGDMTCREMHDVLKDVLESNL